MKLRSHYDFDYQLKRNEYQGLSYWTLRSLDEAIDDLCELFLDDALKEGLCPYFGVDWPAGKALTSYCLEKKDFWAKKKVLELGCGLALPSLAVSSLGADVSAVDFHPDVALFLDENLRLNPKSHLHFLRHNWREDLSQLGRYDVVLGSDILYESAHPEHVVRSLLSLLAPNGLLLLADPGRAYLQSFVKQFEAQGHKLHTHIVDNIFLFSNKMTIQ